MKNVLITITAIFVLFSINSLSVNAMERQVTFPQQIPAEHLEYMNRHDKGMDYVGLHPLNDPEAPMTEEEKKYHSQKAKELFSE